MNRREVPAITWANLAPPYGRWYEFFRAHTEPRFAFQPEARGYSPANAWWLAECAALAYDDPDVALAKFRGAGFSEAQFVSVAQTQCYVLGGQGATVVAFRGTEALNPRDWLVDAKFRQCAWPAEKSASGHASPLPPLSARVHRGFAGQMDAAAEAVLTAAGTLLRGRPRLWLTGHSLGAALATLFAAVCLRSGRPPAGVYTFGSPRVGDGQLKHWLEALLPDALFRVVLNRDIVTTVPPERLLRLAYAHVGRPVWLDASGGVHLAADTAGERNPFAGATQPAVLDDPAANGREAVRTWDLRALRRALSLPPAPLCEHVPVLYAAHLWNAVAQAQP